MTGPTVAELGEFGLIAALRERLPQGAAVLLGPGDDAALVAVPDGRVVVTTDLLVEGVHFRRGWSSAQDVGHKAAAQNLADLAAMGAVPTALVVGLVAPADLEAAWALGLADGLRDEAAVVGASLVGGDLVRGDAVVVAVTALGTLEGREPVTRGGARPGDVVAVCGPLGRAAAGLAVLRRGFGSPRALVEAHRRPRPPYPAGPAAAAAGATAMVDVSDGLLADLGHVAEASGVGVALDSTALPVDPALTDVASAYRADPLEWVLAGGEDHALAATFPPGASLPEGFVAVGTVVAADEPAVTVDGRPWPGAAGYDHYGGGPG